MNEDDIKRFREISERNYSSVTLKIESTLTYITTAALGFFMFMNYKFLNYDEADYIFLLVISLLLLFISFVLVLILKSSSIKYEYDKLTFVERMDSTSESQEQELISIWDKNYMNRTLFQTLSCATLAMGLGMQILFLVLNFR